MPNPRSRVRVWNRLLPSHDRFVRLCTLRDQYKHDSLNEIGYSKSYRVMVVCGFMSRRTVQGRIMSNLSA